MKKFIMGVIVGALLFSGVTVFADSASLVGKMVKIQGLMSIEKSGNKIADAYVINGAAYAPVRAVSQASGSSLSVEGKKIIMNESTTDDEKAVQLSAVQFKRTQLLKKITAAEGGVKVYETKYIPSAQEKYDTAKGTQYEQQAKEWLDARKSEYEQRKAELADLQQQLTDIDAQIAALQQ
ncbi:hypothetical protein [Paenibacillus sp. URB8-2]|uniref:hypothetical protein n=1 Tax=Paenibacillus sp. URB8-2 TaxID=2741301 RepID=UPI0015BA2F1E|nr:hypothetical protein [Paenibacillus sp. URB8-2]BCG57492.1 hypothetical protein PUR_09170 [Paenibacillus sp. URB8-2]